MDFGHLSQGWTTEVDGVLLSGEGYDYPGAMIRFYYQGIISADDDGFANFANLTDQPHRIKFTPIIDYSPTPFYGLNLETDYPNNSFMELDDGSLVFCLAPAASCVPSEPFEFTAGRDQLVSHKRLTYSINGSPPSEFTGLAEPGGDDVDTNFESYFYWFGVNNRVGGNHLIISTSGGNQGAFRIGFDSESGQAIISARDDSYNPLSTTLELIATDHPDDFVTHYFGGSVTLHACGTGEPA